VAGLRHYKKGRAMDSQKLRIKVGEHEFEAEGSPEKITEQFEAWKELVASYPKTTNGSQPPAGIPSGRLLRNVTEVRTTDGFTAPWDIFVVDEKRKLVSLQLRPTGEDRDSMALLLLLFGYKKAFEQNEVLATRLIESMNVSGLPPSRIDRSLAKFVEGGYVMNFGRGKGSKYRLTNTGYAMADEAARELFAKVNITE
jgi:hypothetical protein